MDEDLARLIIEALQEVSTFLREDLVTAPLIEDWAVDGDAALHLVGRVSGHPTIRDGGSICTSLLIAMSAREGWARTLNRFYKLGRPLGAGSVH